MKIAIVFLMLVFSAQCAAREASSAVDDPALEKRVVKLTSELRCLVCQNQSLADSHADLAIDLKNQVRGQMQAGKSDAEIRDYMVARYGDFVLYDPPFKATTWVLWAGPFALDTPRSTLCLPRHSLLSLSSAQPISLRLEADGRG